MPTVKIINHSSNPLPTYGTEDSAGIDLRAYLDTPLTLSPMERALIPTGIHLSLPQGTEGQIRPRSGLAYKQGLTVLNSPGTIDADYRGEVKVLLINLSTEDAVIESGDRIAQMVLASYEQITWESVEDLEESVRGEGGFGHTGVK